MEYPNCRMQVLAVAEVVSAFKLLFVCSVGWFLKSKFQNEAACETLLARSYPVKGGVTGRKDGFLKCSNV